MHTSLLLHLSAFEPFVKKPNAESNVNAHALFVDHARHPVLDKNVGTVGTELVAAIRYLSQYIS